MSPEHMTFTKIQQPPRSENIENKNLERRLLSDLDMTEVFDKLKDVDTNELFTKILDKRKEKMLASNPEFYGKLSSIQKDNSKYAENHAYIVDIRKKFVRLLSETRFFSNIDERSYEALIKYTRSLGKLKDKEEWTKKNNRLTAENPQIMEIIDNLKAGSLDNLKNKYQETLKNITSLMALPADKFQEKEFHSIRKEIRIISRMMSVLSKELHLDKYQTRAEKYESVSDAFGERREGEGHENIKHWKPEAQRIFEEYIVKPKAIEVDIDTVDSGKQTQRAA